MTNVIDFTGITKGDINPDKMLKNTIGQVKELVICGLDINGTPYFASSCGDIKTVLWHLEKAKKTLLEME